GGFYGHTARGKAMQSGGKGERRGASPTCLRMDGEHLLIPRHVGLTPRRSPVSWLHAGHSSFFNTVTTSWSRAGRTDQSSSSSTAFVSASEAVGSPWTT